MGSSAMNFNFSAHNTDIWILNGCNLRQHRTLEIEKTCQPVEFDFISATLSQFKFNQYLLGLEHSLLSIWKYEHIDQIKTHEGEEPRVCDL